MSTTDYLHGIRILESDAGTRPFLQVATGVIGVVATADDADAGVFPLDTPVLLNGLERYIGKAGKSGTLATVLNTIYKQTNPQVVVVRVAENEEQTEQENLVIAGAEKLKFARNKLGITPKVLGAPFLDTHAVTAKLVEVAKTLRGFVYAATHATTKEDAVLYRNKFSARELLLIHADFFGRNDISGQNENINAVAVALGLRAKLDATVGWAKSISNVGVDGALGVNHELTFYHGDANTDVNFLNKNHITVPIVEQGMRLWGSRTCSDDSRFLFEPYVRTAHYLADMFTQNLFQFLDKKLTPGLATDIMHSNEVFLRHLVSDGNLIGGGVIYDARNTREQLFAGQLYLAVNYTPVPPLEMLAITQSITDVYLADFGSKVVRLVESTT